MPPPRPRRRALETRERLLGAEHPDTLASMNTLATLLESQGDYSGAGQLLRRALEISERVLGLDHQETLSSTNNLAIVLGINGNYATAEALLLRASRGEKNCSDPTIVTR